jgi:rhomboid protease GluP
MFKISFEQLTQQQALVSAVYATQQIGWQIIQITPQGYLAQIQNNNTEVIAEAIVLVNANFVTLQFKTNLKKEELAQFNNQQTTNFKAAFINQQQQVLSNNLNANAAYQHIADNFTENPIEPLLPPKTIKQKILGFLQLFVPNKNYFITPLLTNANLLIFIIMVFCGVGFFKPETTEVLPWGANYAPLTLGGQWWRLFTSCFLHFGIMHIIFNVLALADVGAMLEPFVGRIKFTLCYVIAGITGSLASVWWHNGNAVSAGASGAIFGLYGLLAALLSSNLIEKQVRAALAKSTVPLILLNLVFGGAVGADNAAHIGGMLGGFLVGIAFIPSLKNKANLALAITTKLALAAATVAISYWVLTTTPNIYGQYEAQMQRFSNLEGNNIAMYTNAANLPDSIFAQKLKTTTIPNWQACAKILDSAGALKINQALQQQNKTLKQYISLRQMRDALQLKAIEENNFTYLKVLDSLDQATKKILNTLNQQKN